MIMRFVKNIILKIFFEKKIYFLKINKYVFGKTQNDHIITIFYPPHPLPTYVSYIYNYGALVMKSPNLQGKVDRIKILRERLFLVPELKSFR